MIEHTEKINNLVPLGSWCRCAFQVNVFKRRNNIRKVSYPLDWCITPHESLEIIFSDAFDIDRVLANPVKSPVGTIQCDYTKIIFHHEKCAEKAKERFKHAYGHLDRLKSSNNITFVRWVKNELDVTIGRDYKTVQTNITNFLQHDNFKIVEVHSDYFPTETDRPDEQFQLDKTPYYYKLHEIRISKRTYKKHWQGDHTSWQNLLTYLTHIEK